MQIFKSFGSTLIGTFVGVAFLAMAGPANAITINGTGDTQVDLFAGTFHQLTPGSGGTIRAETLS